MTFSLKIFFKVLIKQSSLLLYATVVKTAIIKLHHYNPVYLPADFCYLGKTLKGNERQKARLFNQGDRTFKGSRPMSTKKPKVP